MPSIVALILALVAARAVCLSDLALRVGVPAG